MNQALVSSLGQIKEFSRKKSSPDVSPKLKITWWRKRQNQSRKKTRAFLRGLKEWAHLATNVTRQDIFSKFLLAEDESSDSEREVRVPVVTSYSGADPSVFRGKNVPPKLKQKPRARSFPVASGGTSPQRVPSVFRRRHPNRQSVVKSLKDSLKETDAENGIFHRKKAPLRWFSTAPDSSQTIEKADLKILDAMRRRFSQSATSGLSQQTILSLVEKASAAVPREIPEYLPLGPSASSSYKKRRNCMKKFGHQTSLVGSSVSSTSNSESVISDLQAQVLCDKLKMISEKRELIGLEKEKLKKEERKLDLEIIKLELQLKKLDLSNKHLQT